MEQTVTDRVNHPEHYISKNGLETIDVIEAFTKDLTGIEAVCTANILKYACRWKHKNGVEDLKKLRWYADRLINAETTTLDEQTKDNSKPVWRKIDTRINKNGHGEYVVAFEDIEKAECVLKDCKSLMRIFNIMTVLDLYTLAGIQYACHTDWFGYGWQSPNLDMEDFDIDYDDDAKYPYYFILPKPSHQYGPFR